ncbi:hypothetical protein UPYG_G00087050 [Umbra pygmaea]|uniref:HMG box domain-containing protein n=1 Tax=Umbra pygmaea TaxID=75934 RepID=A0ABD0XEZ4_UMBPY
MDVRFYPTAGGNPIPGDPPNLDFSHCLGYYNYNKFANNNNYMNMADVTGGVDTFHTPSLGDEEFEIPPITPPPETESGLGLSDLDSPFPGHPEHLPQHRGPFTPQFPPQSLELPSITISRNLMDQERLSSINGLPVNMQGHLRQYPQNPAMVMRSFISMNNPNGMMSRNQLTTINQSQLSAQLGLNMTGPNIAHTSPSPPASKSATPSPSSSINEDEQDQDNRVMAGEKRPAPDAGKKPKTPKKKKKKDPNEPQKPVSAYALFFRDTQAAIKGQNPNATFGEVSKIVASMWDGLGEEQKQVYKSKTEAAKKEYLKALAAYRASLVSKAAQESAEAQTIRSVQQTLASTTLSPGLVLPSPLSQHPSMASMSSAGQSLQNAMPRAIAPKPLQLRLGGSQVMTSVTVQHQNMPGGVQSQLVNQMGGGGGPMAAGAQPSAASRMSPPMQSGAGHMQQLQQQQQMQQHLQHHQMQQQQMHHQQIQQQMQHQHFQHHLQQQLQQHNMQQQQQQRHDMQQQQLQIHQMQMQQMHQQQMQQHLQQHLQQQQHRAVLPITALPRHASLRLHGQSTARLPAATPLPDPGPRAVPGLHLLSQMNGRYLSYLKEGE